MVYEMWTGTSATQSQQYSCGLHSVSPSLTSVPTFAASCTPAAKSTSSSIRFRPAPSITPTLPIASASIACTVPAVGAATGMQCAAWCQEGSVWVSTWNAAPSV